MSLGHSYSGSNPEPNKRFKGVVPQQSGHYGAQIYANHHRIWLGTFKSEIEAARAYDSAALNLRNKDSHRNFPASNDTFLEATFQGHFSTDAVLGMIRDGSYPSKFDDFLRNHVQPEIDLNGFLCAFLFQKELTPSDVGKLNRLVIPKRYAVKHFPSFPESNEQKYMEEVQLEFYDRQMRVWKFRYCYWNSSQSFVFTKGWNGFVKEKELRASDNIAFYACQKRCGTRESFLVIDATCRDTKTKELDVEKVEGDLDNTSLGEILDFAAPPTKGFRLFGVQIDS